MQPTVFTKIINREIPANIIYEDIDTIAFLDIHPIQPGHTLVVPKVPIAYFYELPDDKYTALWVAVKKIANRLKQVTGKKHIGVQVIGVDVAHTHIHLVPFNKPEEYWYRPDDSQEPNYVELSKIANKLKF